MESPPSSSTWSAEAFILSDDSGLLLTNSSISSGDSRSGRNHHLLEFQDSDCEDKSFSQDSLDGMSDVMCGENFNTLKKGPNWSTDYSLKNSSPIEPPLEFQDRPLKGRILDNFFEEIARKILSRALREYRESELRQLRFLSQIHRPLHHLFGRPYYTSDFIPFSPCHGGRPGSRSSLGSSRLSSSHNSLSVPAAHRADDSSFITQAVSHDTLSSNQISDLYNVPFDSDVYAVPVDVVKPPAKPKRNQNKKRRRNTTSSGFREIENRSRIVGTTAVAKKPAKLDRKGTTKRHSVAGTSAPIEGEPIHMTLEEVRHYLQTLYSSSSDSSDRDKSQQRGNKVVGKENSPSGLGRDREVLVVNGRSKKNTFLINIKNKKVKDSCDCVGKQIGIANSNNKSEKAAKKSPARLFSFRQTLCNMFKFKRFLSPEHVKCEKTYVSDGSINEEGPNNNISGRALPPLPYKVEECEDGEEQALDFATSIQRIKDYGWYWGPLPSEAAEKILSNEPDGSFIVRDSSDDHYIFSLTFKLNDCVRHVRIDHDQGNFSFGSCTKFKSQTIVEFIENAVEHSRSGRYLFFLHRRPVIGPVRVQLLHPVSRFKQVQSLQHICRFAVHKVVRRDLIPSLPLPRRMIDYLNTPHYYSEHPVDLDPDPQDAPGEPEALPPPAPAGAFLPRPHPVPPVNNYVVLDAPPPPAIRSFPHRVGCGPGPGPADLP